ncbi:MAG: nitroreductase family protein [Bacteroidaceae bacterium]|nr:nitroreductase family protein [Bacteroidaceae bacterium]
MEDFSKLITVRRSHRRFTQEPVADEELRLILRAALLAPSSKGLHNCELTATRDKKVIGHLAQCKAQGADFVVEAPVVIAVVGNPEVGDMWVEDCSVAATMMLLQAEDLGLGACWVQVRERQDQEGRSAEDNVRRLLDIPQGRRVLCLIALGHKGMERKPQNEERLHWEKVNGLTG